MTPMDELFSPEQAVLDREIVAWVRRVVEGFPWAGGTTRTSDTLRAGVAEGNFFTDEATLGHREVYWESELFRYTSLAHRLSDDRSSVIQRARAVVEQTVRNHAFELPADARRDTDRIYRAAEKALL
jgi:trimethylamine:corrinoid methyltransferase-like protein